MKSTMVSRAKHDEPLRIMLAAFRAQIEMVNVHESCVRATRHLTAAAVAPHYGSPNGGRNRLGGSRFRLRTRAHVGVEVRWADRADSLSIALGHLNRGSV